MSTMQKTGWTIHSSVLVLSGLKKSFTLDVITRGQSTTIFLCIGAFFGVVTNNQTTNRVILVHACSWPEWEGSLLQYLYLSMYFFQAGSDTPLLYQPMNWRIWLRLWGWWKRWWWEQWKDDSHCDYGDDENDDDDRHIDNFDGPERENAFATSKFIFLFKS